MTIDSAIWMLLPLLGLLALAVIMTKRRSTFTKRGFVIGLILGIAVILLYYFIR